eukprot:TRINITY_DN34517_c0_g1_i2.p1 TRINITY_DN34517_c0_g1~~TRINITY_DN34517_c0_g1_i2.p1  ORF type:complete len:712 (+),score=284.74 TRINITY_DN34517_c0_g1_i2:227-2362(+)
MRGHITIDVILDIVHAAQSSIHPSSDAMPTELDVDVFITVVVDVIHRLYGSTANDVIDMTVVEHVIEGGLKKSWASRTLPALLREDPALDEISSFPVAEVLHTHREMLMQLFKTYTSSISSVISPYEFMTLMQLQSCLQAMRVIPHLTSAEEVQHTILPRVTESVQELSPHELTETICRIAHQGFRDAAPLSEKVTRLLGSPEMRDAAYPSEEPLPPFTQSRGAAAAPPQGGTQVLTQQLARGLSQAVQGDQQQQQQTAAKQQQPSSHRGAGRREEGSRRSHTPTSGRGNAMSAAEAKELLQDKARLRDAMQRIYLYYACLNSGVAGCEGLAMQKWVRLVQDAGCVATHRHYAHSTPMKEWRQNASGLLTKADVESVFSEAVAETGAAKGLLDFDGLMIAFRGLACKLYPSLDDSPHDALHRLLLEHVLQRGLRAPDVLLHASMYEGRMEDLLMAHKKGLSMLHGAYTSSRPAEISSQQCVKMLMDFKVVPQHLSHTEACQVYLASRLDRIDPAAKPISLFLDCMVRTAHVAFSKQPHDSKFVTAEAKLTELLSRLFVTDINTLKYTLDRMGLKVPAARSNTPPAKPQVHHVPREQAAPRHQEVALDDEEGMDRALRQIFAAYSHGGKMDSSKFLRLCIETKVAHRTEFNRTQVDQTFHVSSGSTGVLNFDEWCDALLVLGHNRYPHLHKSEALRTLLTTCILPLAHRKTS